MSNVIALIPARAGSKGIPGKNFRMLGGRMLVEHAIECALRVPCDHVALSSDIDVGQAPNAGYVIVKRPADLAQDDTPMLAVVQHALQQIPGDDSDIILLVQPTQPFRTPAHLREAVRLLRETQADSVVSLVEVPRTHHPEFQFRVRNGRAHRGWSRSHDIAAMPATRQAVEPTFIRDGTCYAFWRRTVLAYADLYGSHTVPLIIPPGQSCELDTEQQWAEVERRWKERT